MTALKIMEEASLARHQGEGHILNHKIHSSFDGKESSKTLSGLCLDLLSEQKKTWQGLRGGYSSLEKIREREISCDGFSIRLQYNPGRTRSSTAEVGEREGKERRCFLCPEDLPEGQKGILYRSEYLILCNPMPVFPSHFTVSHIDHRRQSISDNVRIFLQLMVDFGRGWTLLYNGPKCGASAPDHLHFQAVPSGTMPIEKETEEGKRPALRKIELKDVSLCRVMRMGRELILLEGDDPMAVENLLKSLLKGLKTVLFVQEAIDEEPMVNIAGFSKEKKWCLSLFPRRKHRPDIFFKKGDARVVVSPGVIDMGGVLITPVLKDFERLDAGAIESIYREVSLEGEVVARAIAVTMEQGGS
jgi:hypothetical protein